MYSTAHVRIDWSHVTALHFSFSFKTVPNIKCKEPHCTAIRSFAFHTLRELQVAYICHFLQLAYICQNLHIVYICHVLQVAYICHIRLVFNAAATFIPTQNCKTTWSRNDSTANWQRYLFKEILKVHTQNQNFKIFKCKFSIKQYFFIYYSWLVCSMLFALFIHSE